MCWPSGCVRQFVQIPTSVLLIDCSDSELNLLSPAMFPGEIVTQLKPR